jgi:hypothetical protein
MKGRVCAALLVELPQIETDALPGLLACELRFRDVSFQFSPARYCGSLSGLDGVKSWRQQFLAVRRVPGPQSRCIHHSTQ